MFATNLTKIGQNVTYPLTLLTNYLPISAAWLQQIIAKNNSKFSKHNYPQLCPNMGKFLNLKKKYPSHINFCDFSLSFWLKACAKSCFLTKICMFAPSKSKIDTWDIKLVIFKPHFSKFRIIQPKGISWKYESFIVKQLMPWSCLDAVLSHIICR